MRAITRLDETCREVRDAARIVGNADLFKKMEECQKGIRRDIVFCASLYVRSLLPPLSPITDMIWYVVLGVNHIVFSAISSSQFNSKRITENSDPNDINPTPLMHEMLHSFIFLCLPSLQFCSVKRVDRESCERPA